MTSPSPFDDVREELDLIVRGITDNAFRLGTTDVEAPQKFASFISTTTVQADEQQGKQPGTTFRQLFDETVGKAVGAVGRGALGAGRFIGESFEPVREAFASPFTTPEAQQALGEAGQVITEQPIVQALDVGARTGGAAVAEQTSPFLGELTRGLNVARADDDAAKVAALTRPTQFSEFQANLARERENATLLEAILMQPSRTAFDETQFNPAVRLAFEAVGEPLNLALPSAIPLLGGARRAASAAERLAADQATDLASRTARVAARQADTAGAEVLTGPAREIVDVVPPPPATLRQQIDRVSPVGVAEAAGPEDVARLTPEQQLEQEVLAAREQLRKPSPPDIPNESSQRLVHDAEELARAQDDIDVFDAPSQPEQSPLIGAEALRRFGFVPELFETGLTRAQSFVNKFKEPLLESRNKGITGFAKAVGNLADPLVDPVYNVVRSVNQNAEGLKNVITGRFIPRINQAFTIADNGTIPSLAGVDPQVVGVPTLQDVAARLPRYVRSLTREQLNLLTELKRELEPMGAALRATGDEFGERPDIIISEEGLSGFYIPRGGQVFDEGSDLPITVTRTRVRGAKPPQERAAAWPSMAEAIAAGREYDPLEQAIGSLVTRTGNRIGDTFLTQTFKEATDEFGEKIGLTAKELLIRDNPVIAERMAGLRKQLQKVKALIGNKNRQTTIIVDKFLNDPTFNSIDDLRAALRATREVQRGPRTGRKVSELNAILKSMDVELKAFKPEYDRALKNAPRNAGHQAIGEGFDFPQLNGRTFPERMAARMNELLKQERPDLSNSAKGLAIIDQAQRVWKSMNATLDLSGVGIQGLVSAWDNPKRMAIAFPRAIQALGTPSAYADWATGFNQKMLRQGGFSIEELAGSGLAQTAEAIDISSGVLQSGFGIPRVGQKIGAPFRAADRSFGAVGDIIRAEQASDLVMESLASGMTKQQMITSGRLREIVDAANTATGFVHGNFTIPNLVMFSARFFSSRIKQILRAARGLDIDAPLDLLPVVGEKLKRKVPKVNKFARDRDRYARRAILRMIGFGTMMTVAVNQMNGNETDFRPVVNGRYNSNFIRIRGKTRDYSVFGPMDSMLRLFVNAGLFRAKDTFTSVTNSPIVNAVFELFENEKFGGAPIINDRITDPTFADNLTNAGRFIGYMAGQTVPFASDEASNILGDAIRDLDDPSAFANDIGVMLGEIIGAKSSEFSRADIDALMQNPRLSTEEKRHLQDILDSRTEERNRFRQPSGSSQSRARDAINAR